MNLQTEIEKELWKIGEVSRVHKTIFGVQLDKRILRNVPVKPLTEREFMGSK